MLLELASKLEASHELDDVQRLTEIELRLEEIGSATAGERAKVLLRNLGFTEALMVGGGRKKRLLGVSQWTHCQ